jgi:hypothetical protein
MNAEGNAVYEELKGPAKMLVKIIGKNQKAEYSSVMQLWNAGTYLMMKKKNPAINAGIVCMHACEYALIGAKTGKEAGLKPVYAAAMCMTFGFTWWVPLKFGFSDK